VATAFIDESRKEFASRSVYILGAVVFADDATLAHGREAMRSLLLPGEPKVHWYGAVDGYRNDIMSVVTGLDAMFVTVWHEILGGESDERSRRLALALLAYELQQLGVVTAVLESRQPRLDQRDLDIFRSGPVSAGSTRIRATHVRGRDEPLLWISDALCGAEGDRLVFNDRTYISLLSDSHYTVSTRNVDAP